MANRFCDGLTRRDALRVGTAALFGSSLGLPQLLAREAASGSKKDVSLIFVFLHGGLSTIDTLDMKPDAPAEFRGEFSPVKTNVPGMDLCELLPKLGQRADKFSLVRSCYHTAAAVHDTGHQMMQTGRLFTGGVNTPHAGCALAYLRGRKSDLPAHVVLPEPMGRTGGNLPHGQDAGFLGKAHDPFALMADPSKPDFRVPDLLPPKQIGEARLDRRRRLRAIVDETVKNFEASADAQLLDSNFEAAFRLMTSTQAREAFDLTKEPEKVRERYGMTRFGQSCLLARRLIESGVRFVTVTDGGWDTHANNFTSLKNNRMPPVDEALPQLLIDLEERGLLDTTLVVWLTDFGRTPQINSASGRDHWASSGFAIMAGAGVPGGSVLGATDDEGGRPTRDEYKSEHIAATIYAKLGIPLDLIAHSPDGRPIRLLEDTARPIREWM